MEQEAETGTFPRFFRDNFAQVAASLSLALGSPELGEEAAAEAFARAYARWSTVRGYESPVGWTYRVGLNHGFRSAKRRGREAVLLGRTHRPAAASEPTTDIDFWALLRALPDRQRIAAALRYGADLTEGQIAQVMRVRRSTVSSALEAARSKLGPLVGAEDPMTAHSGPTTEAPPMERSQT